MGRFSFERLVPSKGLTAGQISFVLRELGFGVKIYSANTYKNDFLKLLRTYVESGIPVVGVIQNNKGIGHALNVIGRKSIKKQDIDELNISAHIKNNVKVYDFANIDTEYVFIDDKYPPYRIASINLNLPLAVLRKSYSQNHKRNIKKLQEEGFKVEVSVGYKNQL